MEIDISFVGDEQKIAGQVIIMSDDLANKCKMAGFLAFFHCREQFEVSYGPVSIRTTTLFLTYFKKEDGKNVWKEIYEELKELGGVMKENIQDKALFEVTLINDNHMVAKMVIPDDLVPSMLDSIV